MYVMAIKHIIGGRKVMYNIMKKTLVLSAVLVLCAMLSVFAGAEGVDGGSAYGENAVLFGLDDTVVHKELCEMSMLYAEVLDDDAKAEGWYYYYTDTDESPADIIVWEPADGNYTTAEVLFSAKNISDTPQVFGSMITAALFYKENEESEPISYDGAVFQQNPGQVEKSGEIIMWSTKPVEIAVGEAANVSFRFDIPKYVYEKLYAAVTGEDNGVTAICEFDFGDETAYAIDLTDVMIPASQYEF